MPYNFQQYENFVFELSKRDGKPLDFKRGLSLVGLGLTGEAGEVADLIKKILHHNKLLDGETEKKLIIELGDILWYVTFLAHHLGYELDEIAEANIKKLQKRFPSGAFTPTEASAKADEA